MFGFLRRAWRNLTLENPKLSLTDPEAWEEAGLMEEADAGVRVTHKNMIGQPPVWRAINLIAKKVAKVPLVVYRSVGVASDRAQDHPAYRLLKQKPNPFLTAHVFKATLTYHALIHGNGFAAIFRDQAGRPVALLPLSPHTEVMQIQGRVKYKATAGNETRVLDARDVLHIKGLSFDGLRGHDVMEVMSHALSLGMAARKFGAKFFANGSNSGGILMLPRSLTGPAREQREKEWKQERQGLDNSFKTAVLEDGAKWIQTTITPEQGQFLQTREFEAREVANIFGLPPHKLGVAGNSSYNSLEQENDAFLEDSIDPWLVAWEDECEDKLLMEEEILTESHFIEFIRDALRRTDRKTLIETLTLEVNNGILTLDETRSILNLPPAPGGIGQFHRMPVNHVIIGAQPQPDNPSAKPNNSPAAGDSSAVQNAVRELIRDRCERMLKIGDEQLKNAQGDERQKRIDQHTARIIESLSPACNVLAATHGHDGPGDLIESAVNRWKVSLEPGATMFNADTWTAFILEESCPTPK